MANSVQLYKNLPAFDGVFLEKFGDCGRDCCRQHVSSLIDVCDYGASNGGNVFGSIVSPGAGFAAFIELAQALNGCVLPKEPNQRVLCPGNVHYRLGLEMS